MELLEIAKLPTAENSAIHLHPSDNVAVARVSLSPGSALRIDGTQVTVRDPVPAGHKIAVERIPTGEVIHRYGQSIGRAKQTIKAGAHVHTHNVSFEEIEFAYEYPSVEIPFPAAPARVPTFRGYVREDGRVGTRNYIAVVAASNCAADTAELIAASFDEETLPPDVDGVVAFPNGEGCGMNLGPDTDQLRRTLAGVLDHPNISSAIILGLGCEVNQIDHYLGPRKNGSKPLSNRLVGMTLQDSGGTRGALQKARSEIRKLLEQASAETRAEVPASKIILGLNCGG